MVAFTDYKAKVAVPTQYVYKLPTGMSFQDGAALLMNYVTAYILLFDLGNLKSGQSLLVHSAGGGVVSKFAVVSSHNVVAHFKLCKMFGSQM